MLRTIHALAAGAAMSCVALTVQLASAAGGDGDAGPVLSGDGAGPDPLVPAHPRVGFAPAGGVETFVWSSETSFAPDPQYLRATVASPSGLPSASAVAVPLPAGVWTGFAGLGGLGAISLVRRLRRVR